LTVVLTSLIPFRGLRHSSLAAGTGDGQGQTSAGRRVLWPWAAARLEEASAAETPRARSG